ncbi:MAG: S-methyl-5'-thioadenosine phosphorylase [Henriciella sp.]|uniref:S-methyl-5'-thioadenosine phosphorylase n=1 Tax=Henriciella sp. TaxID=1968823 RepID=UPI002611275E|nr:S-methyl-5'-thioadenosine phosphorylase [Henriciella sp.]
MSKWTIGVIGGSGLYEIEGLEDAEDLAIETPWGAPSDVLVRGRVGDVTLVFLPRHGKGHRLTPTSVPYRANIDALKRAGCTDILSISACGSLKQAYAPGEYVMVDQFIDRTFAREKSFFGPGMVAHVSMADPICSRLSGLAGDAAERTGVTVHRGGTYLCMEGPQFSSRAESHLYRQWGCDVIGMTNMPEAKLAREAELPYATMAMVTDYDCWHDEMEAVSVTNVLAVMKQNTERAKQAILNFVASLDGVERTPSPQAIETCLDYAMITAPEARDPAVLRKLDAVAGRVLGPASYSI